MIFARDHTRIKKCVRGVFTPFKIISKKQSYVCESDKKGNT